MCMSEVVIIEGIKLSVNVQAVNNLGFAGCMVSVKTTQPLWSEQTHRHYINKWACLCFSKILFTELGAALDLIIGCSLPTPAVEDCFTRNIWDFISYWEIFIYNSCHMPKYITTKDLLNMGRSSVILQSWIEIIV